MEKYRQELEFINRPAHVILTSRGCPFRCAFCSARLLWGNRYAVRSAQNVIDEVQYLSERYAIQGFTIFDSTFTVSRKHVLSICAELKKRGLDGFPWGHKIRADAVAPSCFGK
jgi:anaerobic magnesium-protoporphyrin IX monomethyl ester cyclase